MVDGEGGFLEGVLQLDDGKKAVVMVGHEVSIPGRAYIYKHIYISFCPFYLLTYFIYEILYFYLEKDLQVRSNISSEST